MTTLSKQFDNLKTNERRVMDFGWVAMKQN